MLSKHRPGSGTVTMRPPGRSPQPEHTQASLGQRAWDGHLLLSSVNAAACCSVLTIASTYTMFPRTCTQKHLHVKSSLGTRRGISAPAHGLLTCIPASCQQATGPGLPLWQSGAEPLALALQPCKASSSLFGMACREAHRSHQVNVLHTRLMLCKLARIGWRQTAPQAPKVRKHPRGGRRKLAD